LIHFVNQLGHVVHDLVTAGTRHVTRTERERENKQGATRETITAGCKKIMNGIMVSVVRANSWCDNKPL
jgi:phage host-nuclease inhibitor protein Gam